MTELTPQLSLSERLAALTDPTPKDFDPEEPQWDSMPSTTSGGQLNQLNEDEWHHQPMASASTKSKFEKLKKKRILPDIVMGEKYEGKKISRKSLEDEDILLQTTIDRQTEADNLEKLFTESEPLPSAPSHSSTTTATAPPHVTDHTNQTKKAQNTMNQQILWDALVDTRINFQQLLEIGNRMPSPHHYPLFVKQKRVDKEGSVKEKFDHVKVVLRGLIEDLVGLQQKLIQKDTVFKSLDKYTSNKSHIDFDQIVQFQKELEQCSEPILEKWQNKVLLPSRNQTLKLKTINQGITEQVNSLLNGHNLENIILRSQMIAPSDSTGSSRSFGEKPTQNNEEEGGKEKPNSLTKRYNPLIYNDDEFYSQLLKDRIQSGVQGLDVKDPLAMSQQYLRLRQLRKRKHKKNIVDRRASKGRKIRYQVHEKLLSFMVPMPQRYPREDSEMTSRLVNSMFGYTKRKTKTTK